MGRGQRTNEGETRSRPTSAYSLLYGRTRRGGGPKVVAELSEREQLAEFTQLVAFQLGHDGYVKGLAAGSQNSDINRETGGRIFFDIYSRDGQSVTRLESKRVNGLNGLAISHLDRKASEVEISDSRLIFHTGKLDPSDHDKLEAGLLAKGGIGEGNFVERELNWADLQEKLDGGQSLKLVCDPDHSPVEVHRYLTDLVERTAADSQEADSLIFSLGSVAIDEPEGFLEIMYASQLGRQILTDRGLWRVRRTQQ